jgi:hypothetical protein
VAAAAATDAAGSQSAAEVEAALRKKVAELEAKLAAQVGCRAAVLACMGALHACRREFSWGTTGRASCAQPVVSVCFGPCLGPSECRAWRNHRRQQQLRTAAAAARPALRSELVGARR